MCRYHFQHYVEKLARDVQSQAKISQRKRNVSSEDENENQVQMTDSFIVIYTVFTS